MEKQSTSKFLRSVIAVVALFMLVVSGLFLASCKEEECSHPTTNDFGACTECNVIVDWTKYEAKLDGIITPNFDDLTASLNDLKSKVSDVASDVDSVITKIGDIDLGADITTIVDTVKDIRDEVVALLGAEEVTDKATPATITGIAKALDALQASVNKVQEDITGVEKVCKDHDFDTETLIEIIPASCTENGLGYYRCKNCNAVISQPIEAKGHTEVVTETPVKAGDCTSQITVTTTCSVCGETLKTETKDGYADHEWVIDAESSTATCTDAGEVTYTCAHEGCTVTKKEAVDALGHSEDEGTVTTQPTCTTEGVKTYTCTVCGVVVREEAVEKVPHTYPVENRVWKYTGEIKFDQKVESTTVDQITQTLYDVCSVCGHEEVVMKEDGVTPVTQVTNHSLYIDTELTNAETNGDVRAKVDLTDEDMVKFGLNEGGINADKFVNDYVNVSCTSEAKLYYICADTDCPVKHEAPITVDLPALEHVYVADTTKTDVPATCTSTGIHYEICSACGTTREVVTDKLNHTYDAAVVVEPSCGVEGTKTYTCNVCGEVVVEKIPALEHNYVPGEPTVVYVDNATHEVTTVYTCSNCQDSYEDVNYVAHGALVFESEEEAEAANKYGFNIYQADDGKFYFTNASCDDPGVRIYLCECGYWYEDTNFATKYVPQLKHVYDEDNAVFTEGSCVIASKVQYYCERCGMLVTETVEPADGHTWVVVNEVKPTCTTDGNRAYAYCSVCGAVVEITNGETPDEWSTDYVDGLNYLTDKDAVEAWALKDYEATGHTFNEQTYILIAQVDNSCTDPAWKVYVCTVCGVVEGGEGAADTYKIVKDDAAFEGAEPATVTVGEAGDEFINFLVGELNKLGTDLGITAEMLKSGKLEGFNIKGIEYVAETGHTLTDKTSSVTDGTWGYSENATIDCKVDTNLDSYADALAFAKFVNPELDETEFKAAFNEIFGEGAADDPSFTIKTDGTKPALAGVCKDCGMPIAIADHNEEYYMFMITNGVNGEAYDYSESIDVDNAYVHTDTYLVKDAEGNTAYKTQAEIETSEGAWTKVVFTYEQVVGMKYTNPNGSVNCYFEGFCANGCGIDMGHKAQHTFPVPQQYDKYHNCMHGDICVWCSKVLALSDEHNMQDLEEIAASDITEYKEAAEALYKAAEDEPEKYPWVGKDTENATCKDAAEDWTITVCVSCLLEWYKQGPNFEGWSEVTPENPDGNYTSAVDETMGEHNFEIVAIGDKDSLDCLVGYAEQYVCTVCGYKLTHDAQTAEDAPAYYGELEALNEKDYIAKTYREAKAHKVAPVFNYFENSNYKPATDTTSAYMNFICVDCGAPLQGYYDNGVAEDGKLRYTMASEADIAEYLADPAKVANWGNIQVVRAEDKAAVTTIEFAADATDAEKEAAVAAAIADAEKEGATSVYLTIPGNITFGASDTTTFAEGDTVWQAYGITFSADSSVKKIVFDLGDNKLTFAGTKVDEKTEAKVGATYKITGEGSVIFSNGTIEFTDFTAAQNPTFGFNANTTELVFDHITATVKGSAAFAGFGSNGEEAVGTMTIKNSEITTEGYYVVSTNASKSASSKVEINIIDSRLTSTQPDNDSVGIMFNVPGELYVSGSFVTADSQGMIIRGGDVKATIKDTEVTITGDCSEANVEGYKQYESANWASGNGVPMGAFVIGNRNTDGYQAGLATVVLEKVTIKAPDDVNKVYVYAQKGDTTVDLTITNADAAAPTLAAADITANVTEANDGVYKLTVDGEVKINNVVETGEAQG